MTKAEAISDIRASRAKQRLAATVSVEGFVFNRTRLKGHAGAQILAGQGVLTANLQRLEALAG